MITALDIKTTGLCPWRHELLGVGIYNEKLGGQYFTDLSSFNAFLDDNPDLKFIMHNESFDVNFLRLKGLDIRKMWAYDTRTIASIIFPWPEISPGQRSKFGLENLGIQWLGNKTYKLDRKDMTQYTAQEVADYCLKDCKLTYKLFFYEFKTINNQSGESGWNWVEKWIMPSTKEAANMEYNGIGINLPRLLKFKTDTEKELEEVDHELHKATEEARNDYKALKIRQTIKDYEVKKREYLKNHPKSEASKVEARYANLAQKALQKIEPFNLNSPSQLLWLLKREGLDPVDPMTGKESTGVAVLKNLAEQGNSTVDLLLKHRKLQKLLSSNIPNLLDNIKPDGRVHGQLNVGGTRTGRLSSSSPNIQQISRGKLRQCVMADNDDTVLFAGDYSQLEVRVIAELSKEPKLVDAFKRGVDPYSVFAKDMFSLDMPVEDIKQEAPLYREAGKVGVLSILYRTGPKKLRVSMQKILGQSISLQEAKTYIDNFKTGLPTLQYYDEQLQYALLNKKIVFNLLGRPFRIESNDDVYMKGLNSLVQGSASDLLVYSQVNLVLPELLRQGVWHETKMWVHDEAVLELKADEAEQVAEEIIKPAMTTKLQEHLKLDVPLKLSYTCNKMWEKA